MSEEFSVEKLSNGMVLLGQRLAGVSSAAMSVIVPAGASRDPADGAGAAAVAAEWCLRGAGGRDTRQLNDALDALGCDHHESVQSEHIQLSAAQLGRNLAEVLPIYADILRRPRLEDGTFEPCRGLTLQDLESLEDEPARKCTLLLREKFYPHPLGRCVYGTAESLKALTPEAVRRCIMGGLAPAGTVLSIAGDVNWGSFRDLAEKLFGDWSADPPEPVATTSPAAGVTHVKKDSAQTHIALAHRSAPLSDGHYYAARMAETVLSGGMSGRLFTEVREKRGLVYHVSTRYNSLKEHAGMFTYAGTRPEVAQQTFDVTVAELRRLAEGVEDAELIRARTQLKSALIMQGESTAARAGALVGDWYHLGRLRTLEELSAAIDKVTADDVAAYLHDWPADDFTVLVVGPQAIDTTHVTET